MTKDELSAKIQDILTGEFEIPREKIRPDALLADELDLDSIDFIDIIGKVKEFIPGKVNPDDFKTVQTVQDVTDALFPYVQNL